MEDDYEEDIRDEKTYIQSGNHDDNDVFVNKAMIKNSAREGKTIDAG